MLRLRGDLDGGFQAVLQGLDLLPLCGKLVVELVDPGLGRDGLNRFSHLLGLAVERLPRPITASGHLGDVAISTAEDREGTGNPLRDGRHGRHSLEVNPEVRPTIAQTLTQIVQ